MAPRARVRRGGWRSTETVHTGPYRARAAPARGALLARQARSLGEAIRVPPPSSSPPPRIDQRGGPSREYLPTVDSGRRGARGS